jgi:hypothetical protein
MNKITHIFTRSKKATLTGLAMVAFVLGGVVAVLPAASASAVSCRVQTAQSAGYAAGAVYSKIYYVPGASVSGCKDINVRNIQNLQVAGDHCATFKVQFFPTWGDPYYGKPKTVCSKGPNGPVVPIATNVINGTKYRIWHNVENLDWTHRYQIVD